MTAPDRPLTPRQVRVCDELLSIGADRPSAPEGLVEEVEARLMACDRALSEWTSPSLFLPKSAFLAHLRCEGLLLAQAENPSAPPAGRMLAGSVAHRAIQISYTHPHSSPDSTVRSALTAVLADDAQAASWWDAASTAEQSDVLVTASSRLTNFLDDFPPLEAAWAPRFEEPLAARVGRLRLSTRADLMLGRPRADGRQTLLLVDFKSSPLSDHHMSEADLYAVVATVRHRVPPWRSTVFSLADGTFTPPDVDADRLLLAADRIAAAAAAHVELLMARRAPELSPGAHCRFCPAAPSCPVAAS